MDPIWVGFDGWMLCGWNFSGLAFFFWKTSAIENVVGSGVGGVIAMGVVVDGTLTVGCLWLCFWWFRRGC